MTSKKAIEILNKQIEKLSQNRNENWTIETHTYIKVGQIIPEPILMDKKKQLLIF
jgi:hypothetical protein